MRFTLAFLVSSNLLTASLVWFAAAIDNPVVSPEIEQIVKVEPAVRHNLLEYDSRPGCAPCERFMKDKTIESLEKMGWTVVRVSTGKSVPNFTVWVNGERYSWSGYSNKRSKSDRWSDFRSHIQKAIDEYSNGTEKCK